jgi:hypothetical protein
MPELTTHVTTTTRHIIELAEDERWVETRHYGKQQFDVDTILIDIETDDRANPPKVSIHTRGKRRLKAGGTNGAMLGNGYYPTRLLVDKSLPAEIAAAIEAAGVVLP